MDTPCRPRRKLKRVLKKVDKLNSSSQKLSQKKLKAAINTSLNSTNSFRSLKSNNYSLALRLENVKEEVKVMKDERNDLVEENFALREKVNSLEQILLKGDGKRKETVEVEAIRRIINSLNTHMSNFCVDLEQLAQICFPRTSSSLDNRRSADDRQKSTGDNGDCGVQPVNMEVLSPGPHMRGDGTSFERQHVSSVNKMREIERRVQTENELPRRVRRSANCMEEDEDTFAECPLDLNTAPGNSTLLEFDESLHRDSLCGIVGVEQPSLLSESSEDSDKAQVKQGHEEKSAGVLRTVDGNNSSKQPANVVTRNALPQSIPKTSSLAKNEKKKITSKQQAIGGACKDLYIANEFALNAAHLNIIERTKGNEVCEALDGGVEHTIHIPADMELTMALNDDVALASTHNQDNLETFKERLGDFKPRGHTRILQESSDDQSSDELVPDAVTMKKLKPGQLRFSVGRKNSEGCRKEIVEVPRARSKSKKRMAELLEQLSHEEPKSIFDFHEKTPKFTCDNQEDPMSVYSLAEDSVSSPSTLVIKDTATLGATDSCAGEMLVTNPLDRMSSHDIMNHSHSQTLCPSRSRSRRRTKNTKRSSWLGNDNVVGDNQSLSLIVGETYSQPLKDDSDNSKGEKPQRAPRSRSRRRTKPLLDANREYLSEADSVPGELTLSDSAENGSKRGCRDSEPKLHSVTDFNQDCLTNVEISKDATQVDCGFHDTTPGKLSKISRSRSRRRGRAADWGEIDSSSLLKEQVCLEPIVDRLSQTSDEASKSHASMTDNAQTQYDEVPAFVLGEGSTYCVPLQDSPVKVNKRSKSRQRQTRSRGRPLKSNKTDVCESVVPIRGQDHEQGEDDNDSGPIPSVLGEILTYSVPLKGCSPARTPRVTKRSKSRNGRLTRSTGKSLKSESEHQDEFNGECLGGELNVSTSNPSERMIMMVDGCSSINLTVSDDTDPGNVSNLHDGLRLNPDLTSVNTTRGKKSSRSRKQRLEGVAVEDTALQNQPQPEDQGASTDDIKDHVNSSNAEKKTQMEDKTIEGKKSRSKKGKNPEKPDTISHESVCVDSIEQTDTDSYPIDYEHIRGKAVHKANEDPSLETAPSTQVKKRKRKIKADQCVNENACSNVSGGEEEVAEDTLGEGAWTMPVSVRREGVHSATVSTITGQKDSKSAKLVAMSSVEEDVSQSVFTSKLLVDSSDQDSGEIPSGRQRRNRQAVSYVEPSLSKKLRRGDPFTAVQGTVPIYKSPKLQGKKKSNRSVLESLHNLNVSSTTIKE